MADASVLSNARFRLEDDFAGEPDVAVAKDLADKNRRLLKPYVILLAMHITLAHIGARARAQEALDASVCEYLRRCVGFVPCKTEAFRGEKALLDWLERQRGRAGTVLMLLDGRGRQMSSEELARWLGKQRDGGAQHVVFAVGPADGWTDEARAEAKRRGGTLSLGPMTLAHSLARLVMAEQIYRACTILTGHPYHRGG